MPTSTPTVPTYLQDRCLHYEGTLSRVKRKYRVNAVSGTAAMNSLWASLPATCPENTNLILLPHECEFEEFAFNAAGSSYDVTMVWSDRGTAGTFSIAFDVASVQQHITHSIKTVASYAAGGGTAPNYYGAIGVSGLDHSVAGADISIPALSMCYECDLSPSIVTESWIASAGGCVGKVASAALFGFEQGELMLTRLSGQRQSAENFHVSFGFSILRNKSNFTIGADSDGTGGITIASKKGWDLLWTIAPISDSGSDSNVYTGPELQAAYIEQIYDTADYSVLGLSSLQIAGSGGSTFGGTLPVLPPGLGG